MIFDKEDLLIKLDELKKSINIFNENINKIIEVLNNVKENMNNLIIIIKKKEIMKYYII